MKIYNAGALFEVTNTCNLHCKHCYKMNLGESDLTLAQIKYILEKISDFGIKRLLLTGGEPFLRKDLFKIIDYAVECDIEDIEINTNGTLLDDATIINEIKERLDTIIGLPVSIDGARTETHDFIRGKGQFTKLMKKLENKSLKGIPIGVNVTIGRWNFDDFEEFFRLYDKFNAYVINFGIFIPLGMGKNLKDQILTPHQVEVLIKQAKRKKEAGYAVELCSLPYSRLYDDDISGSCCNIFTEFLTITAQGNIIPCVLYKYNCGSVLEMELHEIFSDPLVQLFREPNKLQEKMQGPCSSCRNFNKCKGGCKLLTYALSGTIYNSDPLCPFQKKQ